MNYIPLSHVYRQRKVASTLQDILSYNNAKEIEAPNHQSITTEMPEMSTETQIPNQPSIMTINSYT